MVGEASAICWWNYSCSRIFFFGFHLSLISMEILKYMFNFSFAVPVKPVPKVWNQRYCPFLCRILYLTRQSNCFRAVPEWASSSAFVCSCPSSVEVIRMPRFRKKSNTLMHNLFRIVAQQFFETFYWQTYYLYYIIRSDDWRSSVSNFLDKILVIPKLLFDELLFGYTSGWCRKI